MSGVLSSKAGCGTGTRAPVPADKCEVLGRSEFRDLHFDSELKIVTCRIMMRAQPECTASRGHDAASARFRTGKRSRPASPATCQPECQWHLPVPLASVGAPDPEGRPYGQ